MAGLPVWEVITTVDRFPTGSSLCRRRCADGLEIAVPRRVVRPRAPLAPNAFPRSGVFYGKGVLSRAPAPTPFVSGVRFDRAVATVLMAVDGVRTVTFPNTIRTVGKSAFSERKDIRSVVPNPGLESLEGDAFYGSQFKKIHLPGSLRTIGKTSFCCCTRLRTVYVDGDCSVDVRAHVSGSVAILPSRGTMAGAVSVWDLRALADVVLPDGLARVGDFWFAAAGVRRATIPGSVREVGTEAFFRCRKLQRVTFAEDGLLERLGARCFQESALQELRAPVSLREICSGAFARCTGLKRVSLGAGLKVLADDAFAKTKFEGADLRAAGSGRESE